MPNEIINLKDLYQIQKTITFELKSYYEYKDGVKDVEFKKTQDFVNQKYFGIKSNISDGIDELKMLIKFGSALVRFTDSFSVGLTQKFFDWFGFEANKTLIEKFDRDTYHRLKKNKRGISIKMTNPNTGREFQKQLIFSDLMPLDSVIMMTDKTGYQITDRINQITDKIKFFQSKTEIDLENIYSKQTKTEKVLYFESGKAIFYGFVKNYISNLQDLIDILILISSSQKEIFEKNKEQYTKQVQENLGSIKKQFEQQTNNIKQLEEVINEEAKKPIILTTLNPRAVNKDSKKVEAEYQTVLEMGKEMKDLEYQLDKLNKEKFEIVQELENKLKNSVPELAILKQDIQPIINKKKDNYNSLADEEIEILKRHKFAKTVLKYIKMEGVVVKEKDDLRNYRQAGERLAERKDQYSQITQIKEFNTFSKEYFDYVDFCKEKREKATKLGNLKSFYNAISREVLRQKEMQYLSLLAKDKDYFYLALIDKEYNRAKRIVERLKEEIQTSDWQILEYHKITFKAIEKLALLGESTFDIDDPSLQSKAKSLWNGYKTKLFKEYKNNRALQGLFGYQKDQKREELRKEELVKIIDFVQRVIEKLSESKNYKFHFRRPNEYKTLEEFADEIDKQGYASKWVDVNKEKLFELEKEEGKNVLVFKLHNKDFRRTALNDPKRKKNLFTEYWIDAMKLGQEIRLTPEIDILKRKKEESESKIRILKTSGKEVVEKARNYQDKIYGAFGLEFYPTKKSSFEEVNQKVTFNKNVYYLGLDRGIKSLVSWCLIDSEEQIIKNGDWTTFKDLKNSEHETNYAKKLKDYKNNKDDLAKKYQEVSGCKNEARKKILIEKAKKIENDLEIEGLLAAESIKKSYCSYLINEINQILKIYPNTYIVLEDLDIKGKVKSDETINNKIQNLEKTLGGTVYQAIENAIVNKFKYYVIKEERDYDGLQLVPNIVKVEDLRVVERFDDKNKSGKVKWVKSKEKVGNIFFVDEYLTSDECPNCRFNKDKIINSAIVIDDKGNGFIANINGEIYTFPREYFKNTLITEYNENKAGNNVAGNKNLFSVRMKKNDFCQGRFKKNDFVYCSKCQFSSENNLINPKLVAKDETGKIFAHIKTGDDLAAYNIAKRGLERLRK